MLNIVLYQPEIPQNTGNIVRTCAALGCRLHLIRPLGYSLDSRYLKRAGLDYWDKADVAVYDDWWDFIGKNAIQRMFFLSTKGERNYSQVEYEPGDYIVFGKESYGLPETLLEDNYERCLRIPMREGIRSLNLSNSVAIVAFEAFRQQGFAGLKEEGRLTGRQEAPL